MDVEINESRKNILLPSSNNDISTCGSISEKNSYAENLAVMKKFVKTINSHDVIWTDRLHVGIAAFLLGKKVHLFDNSYGKVRAVFESTIRHLDSNGRVVFHNDWKKLELKIRSTKALSKNEGI